MRNMKRKKQLFGMLALSNNITRKIKLENEKFATKAKMVDKTRADRKVVGQI